MIHRVPFFATAALLIAGALTGTCREANACSEPSVAERSAEIPAPEIKAAEPTAPQGAPTDPVLSVENAATPAPAPSREATKPNRKGRPVWPPPPELIA